MENDGVRRINASIPDVAVERMMHDFELRNLLSQTRKEWRDKDSDTRKHITMPLIYASTPEKLKKRFPKLQSLKLKGKPRIARFGVIPENWGGYASPWIRMIQNYDPCLNSIHLKRMIVSDNDLFILAERGESLFSLKLEDCSGFTTDGLKRICKFCTKLRDLSLERSSVIENDGEWLHELALNNNKSLETLNFHDTGLYKNDYEINTEDLELLAGNCPNLVSVKITDCEILDLNNFFRLASSLEEFSGGIYGKTDPGEYAAVILPTKLSRLGLTKIKKEQLPFMFPSCATQLTKLDLLNAFLNTVEDHCTLIQRCPNLEILVSDDAIGDSGLKELGLRCRKLKRLTIKRDGDAAPLENEEDTVTQTGLNVISRGCPNLEYISVEVTNITNEALEHIGAQLKNLCDFRLNLIDNKRAIPNLPLDNGVRDLLSGCKKLRKFALCLQPGWLTDVGLGYIGQHSENVKWMLLGDLGRTDIGLLQFSNGCPSLQNLEIKGSPFFSESALAVAAQRLKSLRYLWVQGYRASPPGLVSLATARDCWNTELIPSRQEDVNNQWIRQDDQIFCYHSLAGPRADIPGGSWCAMVLNH